MNLDDLLKSIRDDGKKESALVKYEGKGDEDLVDEEIDERILNFLGLEDIFDIDYGTYQTLLKEKLVAARMGAKKIPTEEDELLVKELRRVKSKTGRFKLKKKKITADSISGLAVTKKAPLLLTGKVSVVDKPIDAKGDLSITPILDSILSSLKSIFNIQQKSSEKSRKESENKRRKKKEEDLEKGKKAFQNIIQTVVAPLQNILDRIWKFIFFTILGRAFGQLMDWLKNPENQGKLSNLVRFVKDWWPSLLAAYLLFLSPFGIFVKSTLTLVKLFGKQLLKLLPVLKNPFVAVPAAFAGMALLANEVTGQRQAAPVQADQQAKVDRGKALPVQGTDPMADEMPSTGNLRPPSPTGSLQGVSGGGFVQRAKSGAMVEGGYNGIDSDTGVTITGAGPDTQLIAARPGEVVLTPEDQGAIYQKTGFDVANYVKDRKPQFIPTNKVRTSNGLRLANLGGLVGFNQGGMIGDKKATSQASPPLSGNFKTAYDTMKLNFSSARDFHIAGALGNFETEAPGLKPNTYQLRGGPGRGIAQWETPGRWDTATKMFGPGIINNLSQQLAYVKYEMDTSNPDSLGRPQLPYGRKTKSTWLGSKNLIDATTNFMKAYEAPRIPHLDRRLANAKRIMGSIDSSNKLKNKPRINDPIAKSAPKYNPAGGGMGGRRGSGGSGGGLIGMQGGGLIEGLDSFGRNVFETGGRVLGGTKGRQSGVPGGGWIGEQLGRKKGKDLYEQITDPIRRQGGGLIEGLDSFGRNVFETGGRVLGGTKGRQSGVPGGGWIGEQLGRKKGKDLYEQITDPIRRQGGGLIKENTGRNIPGAAADRQLIAAQPGEYMIPSGTVSRVGKSFLDQLVANSDSDSTPAKLGMRNKRVSNITPYNTGKMAPITLPPITQSSGGNMKMPGGSTKVPMVSAVSPAAASERQRIAQQLGIG